MDRINVLPEDIGAEDEYDPIWIKFIEKFGWNTIDAITTDLLNPWPYITVVSFVTEDSPCYRIK